jgi:hypothetical protein
MLDQSETYRVLHGYTMGMIFLNHALTCKHRTCGRYGYIPVNHMVLDETCGIQHTCGFCVVKILYYY